MKHKLLTLYWLLPCVLLAQNPNNLSTIQGDDSNVLKQIATQDNENNFMQQGIELYFQEKAIETLSSPAITMPIPSQFTINNHLEGATNCLPYNEIKIEGITLIDKKQFIIPKCITTTALNQLSRQIIGAYIKAGYIQTSVKFSKQDKALLVKVGERRLREITGNSRSVNINTLFPNYRNRPLDTYYLEQGIERANALSGNNVTMDVYPHVDGTATVALDNKKTKPWFADVGIDNYGSKPNKARLTLNVGVDSPLGLSDSLYLGAYSNITSKEKAYSRGANIFYRVPYGAWSFDARASLSKSRQQMNLSSGTTLPYRNQSTNIGMKAERVVSRGASHITSIYGGLDYSRKKATIADSKPITVQSPTLSNVQLGVKHLQKFSSATTWVNDISLEQGIKAFGSGKDGTPFTPEYLRLQAKSNLNHYIKLTNGWLLHNQHTLELQYSNDELYSSKSFDMFNRYGVRGFDEFSQNGKKGVLLRNTLSARRYTDNALSFEPYVGLDVGVVADRDTSYFATGVALGVNIQHNNQLRINVEASQGTVKPDNEKTMTEQQISASLNWRF